MNDKKERKIFDEDFDSLATGVSTSADLIRSQYRDIVNHYYEPLSRKDLVRKFRILAETWKYDNANTSSISDIITDPAYQEIIGLGSEALPYIFNELKQGPNLWFSALKSISGEDPVPKKHRGNIPKMTKFWLSWGKEKGFID